MSKKILIYASAAWLILWLLLMVFALAVTRIGTSFWIVSASLQLVGILMLPMLLGFVQITRRYGFVKNPKLETAVMSPGLPEQKERDRPVEDIKLEKAAPRAALAKQKESDHTVEITRAEKVIPPPAQAPDDSHMYAPWSELDRAVAAFKARERGIAADWEEFRYKYLRVPDWYDHKLDPLSDAYKAQQDRIWQMMIGENSAYDPLAHELTDVSNIDALKAPGFYSLPVKDAGEHLIAMGHIIKLSGLHRGLRALEYGAGFGQIALNLARLGVIVDTVDIDQTFCKAVQAQADWFGVNLKSHLGEFGDNPSGLKYNLVLFYEAFHHARDFASLIAKLRDILVPGGKVIMAGEPILPAADGKYSVPYPWGMRLPVEVAAVVRIRHWYELGFHEEFLVRLFNRNGFLYKKHYGHITNLAIIYEFVRRPAVVKFNEWQFPPDVDSQWNNFDPDGRWTKASSIIPIDCTETWTKLKITCHNHHPALQEVKFRLGDKYVETVKFRPGELLHVLLERPVPLADHADHVTIETETIQPSNYGSKDQRHLGIYVKEMEYIA
jgi:2-polyprenyl-3-methyl-5-hydroxy-6-metoxy-1,4-benzoquinol methylase